MSMVEVVDLYTLEQQWENTKKMVQQQNQWATIVSRAQAQLHNDLASPMIYLIDPMVIFSAMVYDKIETYEQMSADTYTMSKLKIEAVDDLPCYEGRPIWDRLNGENVVLYKAFARYRDMDVRDISKLAEIEGIKVRTLDILSRIWHWKLRVKLFDMNEERIIELNRHRLVRSMQNTHQETASKLFKKSTDYLLANINDMDPKDVIALMDKAVKLERLSLGLSPDKVGEGEATPLSINVHSNTNLLGAGTPAQEIKKEITPENKNEITEEMAKVLAVINQVGGLSNVIDIPDEELEEVEATEDDES